ncbi:MAG: penicillin-binding protein 2 [bacterium]
MKIRKKIIFIFGIFILLFSILTTSFARWQIFEGERWSKIADDSRKYTKTIQNQRGIIKDQNGLILASNEIVYDIYVDKKNVKNIYEFVPKLAQILNIDEASYKYSLNNDNVKFFPIAKKVNQELRDSASKLDCELNIPEKQRDYNCNDKSVVSTKNVGIYVEQTSKRIYPNGSLAAHVLGFMGKDENGNDVGMNGVEGYFDKDLTGKTGVIEGIMDQSGNFILRDDLKTTAGQDGTYLQLTIDTGIQRIVEEKLKAQVESQKAKGGTVVIMDPSTGEILAMANYPTFDPSQYYNGEIIDCTQPRYKKYEHCVGKTPDITPVLEPSTVVPTETLTPVNLLERDKKIIQEQNIPAIFTNQGLSEVREPGSIMKVVTVSAAINEGKATAQTMIPDHPGCIMVTDQKVCTANFVGAKNQTVDKMLEVSDNIGALYVAKSIGSETLYKYLDAFGIGKSVRIELDGESIYPIKDWKEWTEIDQATASFGQGVVSTNSLENISAISTIANNGKRMKPHIVKRYVNGGVIKDFIPQVISNPITESTANQVKAMLERGTREGYTAPPLKEILDNYTMAGKTGTAQIPDGKGGYVQGAYNNTYIGFAPINNPKFIMLVTIREPDGASMASFSAVPVWKEIAKEILPYLGVIPDKSK